MHLAVAAWLLYDIIVKVSPNADESRLTTQPLCVTLLTWSRACGRSCIDRPARSRLESFG
jgi:hypothetical protein